MIFLNRIYGNTDMSWKKVLIFAVCCAFVTGLILCVPFLEGTSLENIGVCFEAWIALALVVIINSEKPVEAGLKSFVFFLISQPLIYLVQVPFSWMHWGIFMYYKRWFIITLLTLPGGMIAWYSKKGNLLSLAVLACADAILLALEFPYHLTSLIHHFPHQLLALAFILFSSSFYTMHFLKNRKYRALSFAIKALLLAGGIFIAMR